MGTFTKWKERGISFNRLPDGNWFLQIFAPPGRYEYAFEVDGQMLLDPKADGTAPHPEFDKVSLLAVG